MRRYPVVCTGCLAEIYAVEIEPGMNSRIFFSRVAICFVAISLFRKRSFSECLERGRSLMLCDDVTFDNNKNNVDNKLVRMIFFFFVFFHYCDYISAIERDENEFDS